MTAQFIKPVGWGEPHFKPSKEEREKAKRLKKAEKQWKRPGNDEKHREIMRQLPCLVCWKNPPNDGHHCKGSEQAKKERGVGMRATDRNLVPLCRSCHTNIESYGSRREYEIFCTLGIDDPYGCAEALWHAPKVVSLMVPILVAHRGIKHRI